MNMRSCFKDYQKLQTAVLKCAYKEGPFNDAFKGCSSLAAGSIKVLAGQLATYQAAASTMDAEKNWFAAE